MKQYSTFINHKSIGLYNKNIHKIERFYYFYVKIVIILLILLCGVVVSTKAISKRDRNDQSDAVYRDNYRYRNQYREEKDDFISIESSSPEEQTTESVENNVEEESEDNLNEEPTTVIAPGEDIKK